MKRFINGLKNGFMTAILVCIMLFFVQGFSNGSNLKFAIISDAHFLANGSNTTFKMIAETPNLIDDAISQVNETPNVDFTIFTGDLIDKPFEKELHAVLPHIAKLHTPWYFIFGNHDVCVGGYLTKKVYFNILREINPDFKYEKSYYSFVPKAGYKAIVLDSIIDTEVTSQGYIGKEQLEWLDNELSKSQKDVVLIFMHMPLVEPFPSPGHKLRNDGEVMAVLKKYKNPIGVFTGHYHTAKIEQQDNIIFVSTPSLASYPNAFRIINISTRRNKVIFDIKFNPTRLTNVQKLSKIMVFHSSLYAGEEKDQSAVLTIKR